MNDVFSSFPQMETKKLILRQPIEEDINDILINLSNINVIKYTGLELFRSLEDAKGELDWYNNIYKNKTGIRWVIIDKISNKMIGSCGFKEYNSLDNKAEIGYELREDYWRKGIMTEALETIIKYGFINLKLNRISAEVDCENVASYNLLLKLGFIKEGILRESEFERGKYIDLYVLSLLKKEYNN